MKKAFVIFIVIAAIGAAAWWWLHRSGAKEADEQPANPTAQVEATPLHRQEIERTLEAFGIIASVPSGETAISTSYECVVRRVEVAAGSRVSAGDLLLEIDPSPETRLQLDSAQASLALAERGLKAARDRVALKLATNQDVLAAEQAEQDARLRVESFTARGLGGDGRLVAPRAGVVSKMELGTGTVVAPGTVLVTIAGDGQFEARLGIEAADISKIQPGQTVAIVSVSRRESASATGQVHTVGAALDATTGAAEVRVTLPPDAGLFFGERVIATITLEHKNAFVVPRSAVLPDGDAQVIFTIKAGKAVRHEVHVGIASGVSLEIEGTGLNENDPVVTLGNYELTDGMEVQVHEAAKEAAP